MTTHKSHKKNLIVSYKNLPDDLKELFKEWYPDGYSNHLTKFVKPNGEPIYVVPLETDDTAYMVKFEVKIDTLAGDLDKALFDEDSEESKEEEDSTFAPLSEAIEKEEGTGHTERVLRHGDFASAEEDEQRRNKLKLDIDKDEIKAAFSDDIDEADSYERDDEDPDPDDYEPSDDDLRGIEDEFLDVENPPLEASLPAPKPKAKPTPKAKPAAKAATQPAAKPKKSSSAKKKKE